MESKANQAPDQGLSLLSGSYPSQTLETMLLSREDWHPYPTAHERGPWEALPDSVRRAYVDTGEEALGQEWPLLLAIRYLDFGRDGNRTRYQQPYYLRRSMLENLVIAECVEGGGRFLDEIGNGIWLICEESSWCVPAHISAQQAGMGLPDVSEPIVDLFAAETSALLAWTDYLLGSRLDAVSPLIRPRLQGEIQARMLTPCLARNDFWWMGFGDRRVNNWNPWINSNWLASALLVEADAGRRLAAVSKSMRSLDRFLDPYPRDGGCDEGPSYWGRAGASLLECLELLHSATAGRVDLYGRELIREIGRFIYRAQIDDSYFVNFADAPPIVKPPPYVVYRYGQCIGDPCLTALGEWLAEQADVRHEQQASPKGSSPTGLGRLLPTLFYLSELPSAASSPPLPRDVWLSEIQVMAARDRKGSGAGLYVAAKGGHNDESHNHNDVGNFVVYVDGKPLLVDAGVETYTRKTFSPQRYDIWTMQSAYHSLPTIDGVMQSAGRDFAARHVHYEVDDAAAALTLDISGAYPPESKLVRWQRTVTLHRGQDIQIVDDYELEADADEITLSLLTPCTVDVGNLGQVILSETPLPDGRRTGAARLTYEANKLTVSQEAIPLDDPQLGRVWGSALTRLVFRAEHPPLLDRWTFEVYVLQVTDNTGFDRRSTL